MKGGNTTIIPRRFAENEQELMSGFLKAQKKSGALRGGQVSEAELGENSRQLLAAIGEGAAAGQFEDITAPAWERARTVLGEVSRSGVALGLTPSETATFVFSIKGPLFALLRKEIGG